jgi:hypothetical protein
MLRVLAGALPDRPCVVVLDELPWPSEQDDTFDGQLQAHTGRLVVSRSGAELPADAGAVVRGPDDIVAAWQP